MVRRFRRLAPSTLTRVCNWTKDRPYVEAAEFWGPRWDAYVAPASRWRRCDLSKPTVLGDCIQPPAGNSLSTLARGYWLVRCAQGQPYPAGVCCAGEARAMTLRGCAHELRGERAARSLAIESGSTDKASNSAWLRVSTDGRRKTAARDWCRGQRGPHQQTRCRDVLRRDSRPHVRWSGVADRLAAERRHRPGAGIACTHSRR
jgi:hypothetical protein